MKRERGPAENEEPAATRHCSASSEAMAEINGGSSRTAQRNTKYDRQLRLWGEHGQAALERAAVCLLNCGATGCETLKNLVLGGVGSVTVVDPALVQERDLGSNFLVSSSDLGESRAKVVGSYLRELNDSVAIDHVEASAESLLDETGDFFSKFTLVIATQMCDKSLFKLDQLCRRHSVMLLVARSYGLVGYVRISLEEHTVVESKPDNTVDDLRLHKPWPELQQLVNEYAIDTPDSLVHKHIPFGIILIKLAEEWKSKHGGMLPSNSKEKSEFKALVASKKMTEDEDNYREALSGAVKVWAPPSIGSELKAVLEDEASSKLDANSSDFWILVAALKKFMANEGEGDFPLDGAIPDMHSFTEYYMQLQKCYQARAEADVTAVEAHVRTILKQLGRDPSSISRATVKNFCKNSRNLRVLRYPALSEAATTKATLAKYLPSSEGSVYLLFRAVNKFRETYNRDPGTVDEELEEDLEKLKSVVTKVVSELGLDGATVSEDLLQEFCRYGAAELHCVGAVVGGIASQEAIKIVTKQLTPVRGTLIYNAIACTTAVVEL